MFSTLFSNFPQMGNKEIFWRMFQSLKSYRFAYISVTCMNVIYDFVGVVVRSHLPHVDHHQDVKTTLTFFDMLFSTTKLEWTGSGYECVCKFYFHLNLPLLSMLECEQAARRPLWCEMNYRGSRKPVFASNNDRWRCFP